MADVAYSEGCFDAVGSVREVVGVLICCIEDESCGWCVGFFDEVCDEAADVF